MSQVIELLRKIPLLDLFSLSSLQSLARHVNIDRVMPGTPLTEIGAPVEQLVIVLRGKVAISRRTARNAGYESGGPGTIIGVLEFLGGNNASIAARAEEETLILAIKRQDFLSFLKEHPEEAIILVVTLSEQLYELDVKMDITAPPAQAPSESIFNEGSAFLPFEEAPDIYEKEGDNPFYTKQFTCVFCGARFQSLVVKSKYIQLEKTDTDFCPYYRSVNPLFYEVTVCPQCGYASSPDMPSKLNDRARDRLTALLSQLKTPLRFDAERDLDLAVQSFRLAFACMEAVGGKKAQLAKLYLKVAWLYRTAGMEVEEREYCEKTAYCLMESYRSEQSNDPAFELNLLYLLANLNFRLGRADIAMRWLSSLVTHPKRNNNPRIIERARDLLYEIRRKKPQEKSVP
jgi:uncharacterized protein (DUF2225 family)